MYLPFFAGMKTNNTNLIQASVDSTIFFYSSSETSAGKTILENKTCCFATANNKFEGTKN